MYKRKFALPTEEEKKKYINALLDNMTDLRKSMKLSRGELADVLGVARQTTYLWEKRGKMSWVMYLALIKFFESVSNPEVTSLIKSIAPQNIFTSLKNEEDEDSTLLRGKMMDFDSLVKGIKEDDYDAMNHLAELFDLSTPIPVTAGGWNGLITSPAIPYCSRCGKAIPCDLEYFPYCPDCGQRLDWDDFLKMEDE